MSATTSDRIKEGMAIRNLKQADLVEKTKISKGALSSYVSGRYVPKQNNIYLIAKALNVNEAWLMGADVPMERTLNDHTLLESKMLSSFSLLNEENQKKSIAYTDNLLSNQRAETDVILSTDKPAPNSNQNEVSTLAAHFDGSEYAEDELKEIRQFAEFVKNKRK